MSAATPAGGWPRTVRDGIGRQVRLSAPPQRIVSLVPSTTETLAQLGLAERVVGRTRYCIQPQPWVSTVTAVGGTKNPDLAAIAALSPDLIVANEEENKPEFWPLLSAIAPLYVAFPRTPVEARDDLMNCATLTGADAAGRALCQRIDRARDGCTGPGFRFACLIWRRPWMAAGSDTYLSALLAEVGGQNVLAGRYPELTLEELQSLQPQLLLLPSEPFPFAERHLAELGALAKCARFVDGQLLTWHGARMASALEQLPQLVRSWLG